LPWSSICGSYGSYGSYGGSGGIEDGIEVAGMDVPMNEVM